MSTFSVVGVSHLSVSINLIVALTLGALIGFERQLFQRYTGVTTHALVALGAAAFTSIAMLSIPVGDPTRVASQVVTGIGFLGAFPGRGDHGPVQPAARIENAGRVDQHHLGLVIHDDAPHGEARRLDLLRDDRDLGARQPVDQGGLAGVGRADHGDESGSRSGLGGVRLGIGGQITPSRCIRARAAAFSAS